MTQQEKTTSEEKKEDPKEKVETKEETSSKSNQPFLKDNEDSNSDFTFDHIFRYVNHYEFCFKTFAKQRWLGQNLYETFCKEFKAFTPEYYVNGSLFPEKGY